ECVCTSTNSSSIIAVVQGEHKSDIYYIRERYRPLLIGQNYKSLDYRLSKGHNGLRCTGNTYWDSIKSAQKPSLSPTFGFPRVSATDKDTVNTAEQQIRPFLRSPPATVEGSITERTRGGPILAVRDRESERDLKRSVRSCLILVLLRGCEEGNPCLLRPSVRRIKTYELYIRDLESKKIKKEKGRQKNTKSSRSRTVNRPNCRISIKSEKSRWELKETAC
ncbi:hypothetical protein V1477_005097, partial [Vespula maculifrons]